MRDDLCYLCAKPNSTKTVEISDTFTDHYRAKAPHSKVFCDRCAWALKLRCHYYNPKKDSWTVMFGRVWSWLLCEDKNNCWPKLTDPVERVYKGNSLTLPIVSEMPNRLQIRQWLINPPNPPFEIVVAESGQKHNLPWSQPNYDRDNYTVVTDTATVIINRKQFCFVLEAFETLMKLGFNKTDISISNYSKLPSDWLAFEKNRKIVEKFAKAPWFKLIVYAASIDPNKAEEEELTIIE